MKIIIITIHGPKYYIYFCPSVITSAKVEGIMDLPLVLDLVTNFGFFSKIWGLKWVMISLYHISYIES